MALPDQQFIDGFDKYGLVGSPSPITLMLMGEWNSTTGVAANFSLSTPLSGDGSGYSLTMTSSGGANANDQTVDKILAANYKRVSGGVTFKSSAVAVGKTWGLTYYDGTTAQFSVTFNELGTFSIKRGDEDGVVLGTTTEAPSIGTVNCLQWDIECNGATGKCSFWLNGVPTSVFNLTNLDLTNSANDYFNRIRWQVVSQTSGTNTLVIDHFHQDFWLVAANGYAPPLTNPVIDTDFSNADFAKTFTPIQHIIGQPARLGTSFANPPANSLILRPFVAEANCVLRQMTCVPNDTNVSAKLKGVIYADNGAGTAPAARLDSGLEVVGTTSGVTLASLMNDFALVKGTTYWIGFILDLGIGMQLRDSTLVGYRAANTYTSGTPNPAPAMTGGQGTWLMTGLCLLPTENYTQLRQNPPQSASNNQGSTVGQKDLFAFDALTVTPLAIHTVAFKPNLRRTDAGARTISVVAESDAAETLSPAVAPATSGTWITGYFPNDPKTGVAWTAGGLGGAHGGYQIIT